MARVLGAMFGDSVVGGVLSPAGWSETGPLLSSLDQPNYWLSSYGVQGMGSGLQEAQLQAHLATLRDDGGVALFGVQAISSNDVSFINSTALENQLAMIARCKAYIEAEGCFFFTFNVCPPGVRTATGGWVTQYDALLAELTTLYGPAFINVESAVANPADVRHWLPAYSTDDIHPNYDGTLATRIPWRAPFEAYLASLGLVLPL